MRSYKASRYCPGALHAPGQRSVVAAVLLAMAILLLFSGIAMAHAALGRSEPAPNSVLSDPPGKVTLYFTEPVEPQFSEIQVLDSQGRQVDNRDSRVDSDTPGVLSVTLSELPRGLYTTVWRSLSAYDGHALEGSFIFSVGEPPSGPVEAAPAAPTPPRTTQPLLQSAVEPFVKWFALLSLLALAGGMAFELFVWRPVLIRRDGNRAMRLLAGRLASRSLNISWLAMGAFLLVSLVQLAVQTAVAGDIPLYRVFGKPTFSLLTGTDWGRWWVLRIVLLLGTAGLLDGPPIFSKGEKDFSTYGATPRPRLLFALLLSCGMLLTVSFVSHAAATTGIRAEALFSDYLHLLAAAFWTGGLFHFALACPIFMRHLSPKEQRLALSRLTPRFSRLAILSVGTLIITGLYSAWAQVTVARALITAYGVTLLIKMLISVPLLLSGAVNLLWVSPRLNGKGKAGSHLRRLVTAEALLAGLVLLSVGFLTVMEPARQAASREANKQIPVSFHEVTENAHVTLQIEPGRVGQNTVQVFLQELSGRNITNATDVSLRFRYLDKDLGDNVVSAISRGTGNYVAGNVPLSIAGSWQVELLVRRPDAFDNRTTFRFNAVQPGAAGNTKIAPSARAGKILWIAESLLLAFLFLGVWLYSRVSRKTKMS